jgi:antitoxin (DNA-binding transcriptional repressor) of toxin-antitoxin stability system
MESVGLYDAKSRLSQLVEKAAGGQRIQITRRGVPVAILEAVPGAGRTPQEAAAHIREMRRGNRLAGASIRELIEEGRR